MCVCVFWGNPFFFCYDVILSVPKIKVSERTGEATKTMNGAIVKAKVGVSDVKNIELP